MGKSPVREGASPAGASIPSTGMSPLRIASLFIACGALAAPYLGVVPHGMVEEVKQLTPHWVGTILVNVFWPQVAGLIKLISGKIAKVSRRVVDAVLLFSATGFERLTQRIKRLKQEQQKREQKERGQEKTGRDSSGEGQNTRAVGRDGNGQVPGPRGKPAKAVKAAKEQADGAGTK
ncbi:hypothetical protein AB0F46_30865 [Streptomyces sp. NPDC026665]|uniref:hypothetical protein n=1 Tax=Streptomyces sp. NPDC026665 TaxID=3154798 RepID=UPI0033FB5E29